jgi:hypothetical protein
MNERLKCLTTEDIVGTNCNFMLMKFYLFLLKHREWQQQLFSAITVLVRGRIRLLLHGVKNVRNFFVLLVKSVTKS